MNLYTLEFDCNTPVTQQINVPTNSDYKVGIKVKKDGQDIDLQPSQLSVGDYTMDDVKTNGYVTYSASTGDNAEYKQLDVKVDTGAPVEVGPDTQANLQKTASRGTSRLSFSASIGEYSGKKLYAKNIFLEASTDNGETWTPIEMDQSIEYARPSFNDGTNYIGFWKNGKLYESMDITGNPLGPEIEYITVSDVCNFVSSGARGAGYLVPSFPAIIRWRFIVGEKQITADFKLNLNAYKS